MSVEHEHIQHLSSNLLKLQQAGKFCDVQLMCSDGILKGKIGSLLSKYVSL